MTSIRYIASDGRSRTLDVAPGTNLMQAAVLNGITEIVGECGGAAMCATCHVYVAEEDLDRLPPMQEIEDQMLDNTASSRQSNSRLSCQIDASTELEGLTLRMPESQY